MIFISELAIRYFSDRCPSLTEEYFIYDRIYGMCEAIRKELNVRLRGDKIGEKYYIKYSDEKLGLILLKKGLVEEQINHKG